MIKTFFYAWGALPWRKPVAMTSAVVTIIMLFCSWATGRDIPNNTATTLVWFDGFIISWAYGTSAFEAVKACAIQKKEDYSEPAGGTEDEQGEGH